MCVCVCVWVFWGGVGWGGGLLKLEGGERESSSVHLPHSSPFSVPSHTQFIDCHGFIGIIWVRGHSELDHFIWTASPQKVDGHPPVDVTPLHPIHNQAAVMKLYAFLMPCRTRSV